jgi:Resolvase, N terminal domain
MTKILWHSRNRTAIYARVSTLDQDPAMQLRELRAYATLRNLPIIDEFIDHVTGTTTDRPHLHRLWQVVRTRKVDTILVQKARAYTRLPERSGSPIRPLRTTPHHNRRRGADNRRSPESATRRRRHTRLGRRPRSEGTTEARRTRRVLSLRR